MTYIIAEIGSNHNGNMAIAKNLIDEAQKAGANAVKFQAWTPESLYAQSWLDANPDAYNDLQKHSLSIKKLRYLANYAKIDFICSVFSRQEVDDLADVLDLYKVASMDINNTRLLKHIASKKKPTIISTGMARHSEILEAVKIFTDIPLTLLHCVSLYPPRYDQLDIREMRVLQEFQRHHYLTLGTGYSDHTEGIVICLAAVALGAICIEKHFTLDKERSGWDHKISATPSEFAQLVREAKIITLARKSAITPDLEQRKIMRRSLVAKHAMKKGHMLTEDDVIWRRPGTGLQELGKLKVAVSEGHVLTEEDLS
jgi:N-acetylneuraminate synthase